MKDILENLHKTKLVSESFKNISIEKRNKIIKEIWDIISVNKNLIQVENQKDLKLMDINDSMYDRLLLTDNRIESITKSCYDLINIEDPLLKYNNDEIKQAEDWLSIKKVGVSFWVVACIYEARPNVTIDIAIMCIKSWNWIILRWGTKAKHSNSILIKFIKEVLENNNIDSNLIFNYPLERDRLDILYNAIWLVDVIIPRWWKKLIESVRDNSKVPIIETWAWVVNLYLDNYVDKNHFNKAINIIVNAKTNRISVCNALDTLIINIDTNKFLLEKLFNELSKKWVIFWLQESHLDFINSFNIEYFLVKLNDFYKEQLSLNLNIIFVNNINEAINHIWKYSSKHSDWIISDNKENINLFNVMIDSSVVYTNTSTRFSDGSCFWFWWEIWISTQKLHARWPMWAESLVTYKYIIESDWKIRI